MRRGNTATCCKPRASTSGSPGPCSGDVAGTLYVVATPLGNLADLSPRAADTLKRAAVVAAEDTRHTKTLIAHVGSHAELVSFHAHSSDAALQRILAMLGGGKDVALVTDAGTPSVSDPGTVLVAAARALFLGFLPRKGTDRKRLLAAVAESEWTVVLFESPNRVADLLQDLAAVCGAERRAAVAREMTKIFEETRDGTLAELAGYFVEAPARGEVTGVVAGAGRARGRPQPAAGPEGVGRPPLARGVGPQ